MGLDIAELVMDLEEAFGIDIPDANQNIRTVGECVDYVFSLVESQPRRRQEALEELRAFFAKKLDINPSRIGLDTPLIELLPDPAARREAWNALRRPRPSVPALELPAWAWWTRLLLVLGGALASGVYAWWLCRGSAHWNGVALGVAIGIAALIVITLPVRILTRQFGSCLPAGLVTIKDLVGVLAGKLTPVGETWTVEEVEAQVIDSLAGYTSVPKDEITRDKAIVDDLGLG